LKEELDPIKLSDAPRIIKFYCKPGTWRKSVLKGRRPMSFISTTGEGDERIIKLHQDGAGGLPKSLKAKDMPRTVLSTVNANESPTALIVRKEMQSWMFLQLEPSSLREPDKFTTTPGLQPDGSRLPATLYSLSRDEKKKNRAETGTSSSIYSNITERLSRLIDDVYRIDIDADQTRELLTLQITEKNGTTFPARSLSDGTLRFLALTVMLLDPNSSGLVCLEEPENGISPQRIPAMLELLQDIACDTEIAVGPDNPLRQVIVNTHSPVVVKQVPDDSLLIAESKEIIVQGKRCKGVKFGWLPDTWRCKADPNIYPVAKGKLLSYLNPVPREKADHDEDENSRNTRRVIDRPDIQPYLDGFDKSYE
jgi:predicted ATPase